MKTLSLRQPYAEYIVNGKKTVEIRNWNTKFRGEFLIHAAKKAFPEGEKLDRGKIVGKAKLVDVKKYESIEEFRKDFDKHLASDEWFRCPCYGFILEDAKRIESKECKGKLNFFEVK